MDKLFRNLPFVTAYMDDLIIYSANFELQVKHLQEFFFVVYGRLVLHDEDANVAFGQHEVKYLGHVFSAKGTLPNEDKKRL